MIDYIGAMQGYGIPFRRENRDEGQLDQRTVSVARLLQD